MSNNVGGLNMKYRSDRSEKFEDEMRRLSMVPGVRAVTSDTGKRNVIIQAAE